MLISERRHMTSGQFLSYLYSHQIVSDHVAVGRDKNNMAFRKYLSTLIGSAISTMACLQTLCNSSDQSGPVLKDNSWNTEGTFHIKDAKICGYQCECICLVQIIIRKIKVESTKDK